MAFAILCAHFATGCESATGTFIRVQVDDTSGQLERAASVELDLTLGGATTHASLPTRGGTLRIASGAGELQASATLRAADGATLAHAHATATVVRGETQDLLLSFAAEQGPTADSSAVLQVIPAALDYGTYLVGTLSDARVFRVWAMPQMTAESLSVSLAGAGTSAFAILEDGCSGRAISGEESCAISARFSAVAEGRFEASLMLSARGQMVASVPLSGIAVAPGALRISPTSQSFANTAVDSEGESHTFTIKNTGAVTLGTTEALGVRLSGSDQSSFSITQNDCPATLPGDAECSVTVRFLPQHAGVILPTLFAFAVPGGGDVVPLVASAYSTLTVEYQQIGTPVGFGRVQTLDGIDCGSSRTPAMAYTACTKRYDDPAQPILRAVSDWGFISGWEVDCAGSEYECQVDMTRNRRVVAKFAIGNYLFVTKNTYTMAQVKAAGTGVTDAERMVSGADALCAQSKAAAVPDIASGNYRAWISTSTKSALARIQETGARGWGTLAHEIGDRIEDMVDPTSPEIWYTPREFEDGSPYNPALEDGVWTGTSRTGQLDENCQDWSSTSASDALRYGYRNRGTGGWTNGARSTCAFVATQAFRLYCFGIDRVAHVRMAPNTTDRKVFISATDFDPASGIAAADVKCQAEAVAASLPGSFKALLATSTGSAASRFNAGGGGFVRPDGVRLTWTPMELFSSAPQLMASINVDAFGRYWPNTNASLMVVWTGADNPVVTAAPGDNCNDWSTSSAAVTARIGLGEDDSPAWFRWGSALTCDGATIDPNAAHRIYCVEE